MAKKNKDWSQTKIDTIKKFKQYLIDTLDNDRFVIYDDTDPHFKNYSPEQISFHGEDEDEVFTFEIIKVK